MTVGQQARIVLFVGMMLMSAVAAPTKVQSQPSGGRDSPSVFDGVLSNIAGTPEISTARLRAALTDSSAIVLDARPYDEYAVSHIPARERFRQSRGRRLRCTSATRLRSLKAFPTRLSP